MTKFLVDECVDQTPIRSIPASRKGFDIAFPQDFSFLGAGDISVLRLAQKENRVLVTSDSDFFRLHVKPNDIPEGILWLHPRRSSKGAVQDLIEKFCRYRQENYSDDPYNFSGQMIEVKPEGVSTFTMTGTVFQAWPE